MGYQVWSVVFGEQPSASKWNILGTNDSSFNDGTGIGDNAIINRHILTGNLYASKIYNPYKFRATRTTAQALGGATFTKMQVGTESYDTGSNYDSVTNYRFTAPVTGYYEFFARTSLGAGAAGRGLACLYKNGTIISRGSDSSHASNPTGSLVYDVLALTAADYVEFWMFSGAAVSTETGIDITIFGAKISSAT